MILRDHVFSLPVKPQVYRDNNDDDDRSDGTNTFQVRQCLKYVMCYLIWPLTVTS